MQHRNAPTGVSHLRGVDAVIFDFYQTLAIVDEDRPAMWETLNTLGYPCSIDIELLFNSDGFNGQHTPAGEDYNVWREANILDLTRLAGVPASQQSAICSQLLREDTEWTVKPLPDAHSTIARLQSMGIPIGICTNWDYDLGKYLLQAGLPSSLPYVTSASVGVRKPDPELLRHACASFGMAPNRTLFVGDSWANDVACALHAGLIPCWLTDQPDRSLGTIAAIDRLASLFEIDFVSPLHTP